MEKHTTPPIHSSGQTQTNGELLHKNIKFIDLAYLLKNSLSFEDLNWVKQVLLGRNGGRKNWDYWMGFIWGGCIHPGFSKWGYAGHELVSKCQLNPTH